MSNSIKNTRSLSRLLSLELDADDITIQADIGKVVIGLRHYNSSSDFKAVCISSALFTKWVDHRVERSAELIVRLDRCKQIINGNFDYEKWLLENLGDAHGGPSISVHSNGEFIVYKWTDAPVGTYILAHGSTLKELAENWMAVKDK